MTSTAPTTIASIIANLIAEVLDSKGLSRKPRPEAAVVVVFVFILMTCAHQLLHTFRVGSRSVRCVLISCGRPVEIQAVDSPRFAAPGVVYRQNFNFERFHCMSLVECRDSQPSSHIQTTKCSVKLFSLVSGLDSWHLRRGLTIHVTTIEQTCGFLRFFFHLYWF